MPPSATWSSATPSASRSTRARPRTTGSTSTRSGRARTRDTSWWDGADRSRTVPEMSADLSDVRALAFPLGAAAQPLQVELKVPFHDCDPLFVVWHGRYFQY